MHARLILYCSWQLARGVLVIEWDGKNPGTISILAVTKSTSEIRIVKKQKYMQVPKHFERRNDDTWLGYNILKNLDRKVGRQKAIIAVQKVGRQKYILAVAVDF